MKSAVQPLLEVPTQSVFVLRSRYLQYPHSAYFFLSSAVEHSQRLHLPYGLLLQAALLRLQFRHSPLVRAQEYLSVPVYLKHVRF